MLATPLSSSESKNHGASDEKQTKLTEKPLPHMIKSEAECKRRNRTMRNNLVVTARTDSSNRTLTYGNGMQADCDEVASPFDIRKGVNLRDTSDQIPV